MFYKLMIVFSLQPENKRRKQSEDNSLWSFQEVCADEKKADFDGMPEFVAPEVVNLEQISYSTDMWVHPPDENMLDTFSEGY